MPRKNRRNPEFFQAPEAPPARADAPLWAEVPGSTFAMSAGRRNTAVRDVTTSCATASGTSSWSPRATPTPARHWHTECWRRELKRLGRYRAPQPGM